MCDGVRLCVYVCVYVGVCDDGVGSCRSSTHEHTAVVQLTQARLLHSAPRRRVAILHACAREITGWREGVALVARLVRAGAAWTQ